MYISHKYKLIFLRTPKTASSSLSEFFIKNIPDPEAIYTPVEDSKLKGTLHPSIIHKYNSNFKYYHFTIEDLIKENIITKEQAIEYRVISVLRNPIDRQKSFYYFYKKWKNRNKPFTIEDYKSLAPNGFFNGEPNSAIRQTDFGKLGEGFVAECWLYENLDEHLNSLMKDLQLDIVHPLPKHKSNFRKNRQNEIIFDEEAIEKMKFLFEKDFQLYNELKEKIYESS